MIQYTRVSEEISSHTFKQGLSVWAPTMVKPLPGLNLAPTAKAMMVEKLLMTKY